LNLPNSPTLACHRRCWHE